MIWSLYLPATIMVLCRRNDPEGTNKQKPSAVSDGQMRGFRAADSPSAALRVEGDAFREAGDCHGRQR